MTEVKESKAERDGSPAPHYSARDARGGEIILKSRGSRIIFVGGLAALIVMALILGVASAG